MRKRKIEGAKRAGATGSKVEQYIDILVTNVIASSLAEEIRDSLTASANRACSDGRGKKNKCRDSTPESASRGYTSEPICNGCG